MAGNVCISIEIELGWGMHDLDRFDFLSEGATAERRYLRELLDVCERLNLPITFDVVGHLLLDSCAGTHEGPYPDDWFAHDPGTDVDSDPLFYAPDMIRAIHGSPVAHELATHSFSHVPGDQLGRSVISHDLGRACQLHEELLGERPVSLVTPRHKSVPTETLRANGIEIVRVVRRRYDGGRLRRYKQLLLEPYSLPPPVVDQVVETYVPAFATLTAPALPDGRRQTHPSFRLLPKRLRRRLHVSRLVQSTERAAETDGYLHLWTHLWNLSNRAQFETVTQYLEQLAVARDDGAVDVTTMGELNRQLRADALRAGGVDRE